MLACIRIFLWAYAALLIGFLMRSWREMHFWQKRADQYSQVQTSESVIGLQPTSRWKTTLHDSLGTSPALLFRAQTTAGRLWQRRLRAWMTCTRVVLKRDRCWRIVSAGGGGQVAAVVRQISSVWNVFLHCGCVSVPHAPWQVTCFYPADLFVSQLSPCWEQRCGKWQVGAFPAAHWAQLGDRYHTTIWYPFKN